MISSSRYVISRVSFYLFSRVSFLHPPIGACMRMTGCRELADNELSRASWIPEKHPRLISQRSRNAFIAEISSPYYARYRSQDKRGIFSRLSTLTPTRSMQNAICPPSFSCRRRKPRRGCYLLPNTAMFSVKEVLGGTIPSHLLDGVNRYFHA